MPTVETYPLLVTYCNNNKQHVFLLIVSIIIPLTLLGFKICCY